MANINEILTDIDNLQTTKSLSCNPDACLQHLTNKKVA